MLKFIMRGMSVTMMPLVIGHITADRDDKIIARTPCI